MNASGYLYHPAAMSLAGIDKINLLKFPESPCGAFSKYKPGSKPVSESIVARSRLPGSSSPPRKSARLDGDEDHSNAASRSRDKGKGKEVEITLTGKSTKTGIVISPRSCFFLCVSLFFTYFPALQTSQYQRIILKILKIHCNLAYTIF